jgi:TfoX/Sxy family transcriptional regulator of competence genes
LKKPTFSYKVSETNEWDWDWHATTVSISLFYEGKYMPWKKANKALIDILGKHLADYQCDRRLMFGAPTYFVNGNMFAGVHEDTIILRLSEVDLKNIFSQFEEVKPFTPMGTHVMKEYATLPLVIAEKEDDLKSWLNRSYNYASSLPPKPAKQSSKRKNK